MTENYMKFILTFLLIGSMPISYSHAKVANADLSGEDSANAILNATSYCSEPILTAFAWTSNPMGASPEVTSLMIDPPNAGTALGAYSLAFNAYDGLSDGKLTGGEAYKIAIAGASLNPVFGAIMGVTDFATQMYFGTSLTDMVANGMDSSTGGAHVKLW